MTDTARRGLLAVLMALAILCPTIQAESAQNTRPAAPATPQAAPATPQAPPAAPPRRAVTDYYGRSASAGEVRAALREVLGNYSPSVGRVLAMDPTLLQNPSYLEPYPRLAEFLRDHPEVVRDQAYFLADYRPGSILYSDRPDRESQVFRLWSSFFSGMALFAVFLTVTFSLAWVIKTLIDYRRWIRLSKVQTEAHNKLLDRFTANENLLAYISTPSGQRFLESAPFALDASVPSIGAPVRRILWAIEVGLVVACGGGGLLLVHTYAPVELGQLLKVVGVFTIALGVGFMLSAAASYALSSRLGLLATAMPRDGRDRDAPPAA